MLRNKLMTACSAALLAAALYGCSSSSDDGNQVGMLQDQIAALNAELGEGEELTPEALAALIQEKADAEAALADAMIAHQAALDQAAMDAETAKTAALAAAAMEAMTAHEAALAAAAMEAMTAQEAALAAAAIEAMTAHEAALAAAAMEAMTAHEAALAAAAIEAMTAHEAALAAAAIAAADMAAADKAQALADAQVAADAAQVQALADAQVAADAAQVQALADAQVAADAAQVQALADAQVAADAAQVQALADAQVLADAAQVLALADAKVLADAAQVLALADAQVAADAALKVVQDELDEAENELADIKRDLAVELAAQAADAKSEMAAEVLKSLATDELTGAPIAPTVGVAASSNSRFTAEAAGYTMSGTPEGISGFRGVILTKDGAEARVYTNIEDAVATPLGDIYNATIEKGKPKAYSVTENGVGDTIAWTDVERSDAKVVTIGVAEAQVSTFAGSVIGLPGVFSCTGAADCMAPERQPDGSVPDNADEDGWAFSPTSANGRIDVADEDGYLQFGWWLNPMGDDVDDGFNVRLIAKTANDADYGVFPTLSGVTVKGSATYRGGAAGKWAIASTTEDSTAGGHFTATATLGVDFDDNLGGDAANDEAGVSVSGTITNFMTGNVSRPSWKVALSYDGNSDVELDTAAELTQEIMGATKWSTGGAVDGVGTWEARFHGSEKETDHPTAVEGTFNAAIAENTDGVAVGRIAGAFGATNQ